MNSIYDKQIQGVLFRWKKESGARRVIQFKYSKESRSSDSVRVCLDIYTSEPGILIGRHGHLVNKYSDELIKKHIISNRSDINFKEVSDRWA